MRAHDCTPARPSGQACRTAETADPSQEHRSSLALGWLHGSSDGPPGTQSISPARSKRAAPSSARNASFHRSASTTTTAVMQPFRYQGTGMQGPHEQSILLGGARWVWGGERPTCAGLLLVHVDHALLLVLVAIRALLLALPVEGWPRVAAILCTPAVLDVHHALLQSIHPHLEWSGSPDRVPVLCMGRQIHVGCKRVSCWGLRAAGSHTPACAGCSTRHKTLLAY